MSKRINTTPTEDVEQSQLFAWANWESGKYPELKLMYHIPNGGKRTKSEAARFKMQGVKSGIPDIFLSVPRGGYCGLYIELKRVKGGRISESQGKILKQLEIQGYASVVCYGAEQAQEEIIRYLKLPKHKDILKAYQEQLCIAECLDKRLNHLLESNLIKLFDDKDISTREYKLDINYLDKLIEDKEVKV